MKKITLLLIALFSCWQIQAQVSLYSFAQSNETYTEITGGTILGTSTTATSFDSQNWAIADGTIPFDFTFNGLNYTGCTVNSNGFITFGATAPGTTLTTPISSATAYSGAISAWGGDLCGVFINNVITGETSWEVVGDAPNREFVIQFKNWRPAYSASVTDVPFLNFQIRLSETTNLVKIVYGPTGYAIGSAAASGTRQIGLRGATNGDFKNRINATTLLFTASTAGTGSASSQAFNTAVATPGMPSNGLVYTFTPPAACSGTPIATTVLPVNQNLNATQASVPLVMQQYADGTAGLTFQWEQSTDGGATWENVTTGTGGTTRIYTPVAFAGTNIAYRARVTCTASSSFEFSSISTITNCSGLPITNLPWTEGFEGLTTVGTTTFPMCWFKQNGDWASRNLPTSYTNARTGTNYITNSWTATDEFIWTPGFTLTEGVSYDFSSYVQGDNATGWVVDYFVNSTNSGTGATQLGGSYSPPGVTTSATAGFQPYVKMTRTFVPATTGVYYFAVRVNQPSGAPWYVAFDDFTLEETPTCFEPTSVTSSNIQDSTATVSWIAPASVPAEGYEYFVSTTNQLPTTSGTVVTTNSASLTNLNPNTVYFIYVRSVCSTSDFSAWAGPTSFKTQCEGVTEYMQDFDAITTNFSTTMPDCWTRGLIGSPSLYITNGSVAPMTPSNRLYMSATASGTPTEAYAILPPFSNLQANTHRLRFKGYASIANRTIEVGYITDPSNLATYTALEIIVLPGTVASTAIEFIIIPGALPAGVKHLAIRNNGFTGTPLGTTTVYLDDFFWEAIPTCNEPSALTVSSITNTSAVLGWTEANVATAWEIQYGAPGFTLGSGTIVSAPSNPFTLTSLTPNTNYVYYVRAVCSESESSFWTGPFAFKTQCDEVTEFFEDFDSLTSNFSTTMPDCWGRGLVGAPSLYVTTGSTLPMSPNNRLYMFVSSTATPAQQAYAILPPVSNLAAGTHRLRFKAFATAANRYIEIGYLTNPSDLSTFEYLADIQLPSTAVANTQQFTFVPPTSIPAGIKNLVILNPGYPSGTSGVYIDDVYWEPNPSTVPSCATNVVATPNATCGNFATGLSWDITPGADGYKLKLGTTPGGSEILNNENIGFLNTYSFVGNFNTTYYYTLTPYNSFGDAVSCNELSFTTAPDGCYCTSLPTSNDGLGITNVLLGSTNFPTPDVTYFDHTATTVNLLQGLNNNVQITFATGYTYNTHIWIDFNDNYTFEANELVYSGESLSTNPTTLNASFVMPVTATLGLHRMRIVTADVLPIANPCYSGTYGVTLDFNVNIVAPTCTPPSFSTVTTTPNCDNDTFYINVNVTNLGNGTPAISDGTTSFPVTATGVIQVGPFASQSVTLTLLHGLDADCNSNIGTFINECLPVFCLNAEYGQWPTATFTPACSNTTETIVSNAFASEYSAVNVLQGYEYTFASSIATDYITISNIAGTVPYVSGTGLVSFTADFTGTIRFYTHLNDSCGSSTTSRIKTVQCVSLSTPSFDSSSFSAYPNPVKDVFNFAYSNTISDLVIYNLLGQQVLATKPNAT
ncbi:MAG: fibronectin type III domain-containing protein, partial [Flavobacterium sp.]|nr:fibronectin type III domain-containing protein [Flavobacterium sp.]